MKPPNFHWSEALPKNACSEAKIWARTQPSAVVAWRQCKRGDWMLWLLGKFNNGKPYTEKRKPIVRIACECARQAWRWMPAESRAALETIERWTRNEASAEDCKNAKRAAYDATVAADATTAAWATAYAAYAAYAAAACARERSGRSVAPAVAAASYADYAADAAYAEYASDAAAAADARAAIYEKYSDIVRKEYLEPPEFMS